MESFVFYRIDDAVVSLEELYIRNSPYLSSLLDTTVGIDKDQEEYVILEVDTDLFNNYMSFLKGEDFQLTEEDAIFFDFMGHHNQMQYPLDFWKITLREKWVRDNMYKLKLYEDSYYDLVQIPIKKKFDLKSPEDVICPAGTIIAGGAALWMATGYDRTKETYDEYQRKSFSDIDIFFVTDKEKAEQILQELIKGNHCNVGKNAISFRENRYEGIYEYTQCILRLYKGITEVLHGFDVDCCGIAYDPATDSLWATRRAAYAIKHRINYINPERASPSYYWRLSKYNMRGFQIGIPVLNDKYVDLKPVKQLLADLFFTVGLEYLQQHIDPREEQHLETESIRSVDEIMRTVNIRFKNKLEYGFTTSKQYASQDYYMSEDQYDAWSEEIRIIENDMVQRMERELRQRLEEAKLRIEQKALENSFGNHILSKFVNQIASHCSSTPTLGTKLKMIQGIESTMYQPDRSGRIFGWHTVISFLRGSGSKYHTPPINHCSTKYTLGKLLPHDPASIIIMAKYMNLHCYFWKESDYDANSQVQKMHEVSHPDPEYDVAYTDTQPIISDIQWKEQNPMEQVTSTFHPEPINNIFEWLSQSPLYQP